MGVWRICMGWVKGGFMVNKGVFDNSGRELSRV